LGTLDLRGVGADELPLAIAAAGALSPRKVHCRAITAV
jgi:hypothetical protein